MTPILALFMSKDSHFYATHAAEARERGLQLRAHASGKEELEHHGNQHNHYDKDAEGEMHGSSHDDVITGAIKEEQFYESMVTR